MVVQESGPVWKPYSRALLAILLAWCIALVLIRVWWKDSGHYLFLIWNLFLACVPLVASTLLRNAQRRNTPGLLQLWLLAVWLLFLPNAPYILTDLVHLHADGSKQYWYDLGMLLSCAGTGLLLGYSSLFQVHKLCEERFGSNMGWSLAAVALLASGYGVYLGRIQRWNSWDIVTSPRDLLGAIAETALNPVEHFHIYVLSGLFGLGLLAGYATLYSMFGWQRAPATE